MIIDAATCSVPSTLHNLADTTLYPSDDDRVFAILASGDARMGIRVIMRDELDGPRVIVSPNLRIPNIAGARKGFLRFCYEQDNDALLELHLDEDDGELSYLMECSNDRAAAEELIRARLEELPALVDAVRGYVAACIERARHEAA